MDRTPRGRPLAAASGGRRDTLAVASLLALFALAAGPHLARCYRSAVPGGWDGIAHFAIAEIYARRIFPALSGWVPEYFAGMPFPDFYPPLFYVAVAALIRLGVPSEVAFLGLQTLATAAVPLLVYAGARRLTGDRVAGWVAGALAVAFLVDGHPISSYGITLLATFGIGLSTQLLGFVFVLAFYVFLLGADRRPHDAALAALCLAAVALTNVHVVWDAAFLFAGLTVARTLAAPTARERLRVLGLHAAVGGVAVALSMVWVLPMLARLEYVPTMALEPPPAGLVVQAFFRLGVYLALSVLVAWADRNVAALGLVASMALLLAASLVPPGGALEDLALQPGRFMIGFQFLTAFLVGYLVSSVRRVTSWPWARHAAALVAVAIFFAYVDPVEEPIGNVSAEQAADYRRVLAPLAGRTDGRVLVEMGSGAPSDTFGLQALVGRAGARSLTTVFRESAVNVLFAAPLRNSLSTRREMFGIDSKVPPGEELAAQPAALHRARLELFDVRAFVLKSPAARSRLEALLPVRPLTGPGRWAAYELAQPPEQGRGGSAVVPAYQPVLTFAAWSVKRRPEYGFDFVRLGEEMFAAGRLEIPLALSRTGAIDEEADWDRFRVALVTEYRYRDLEKAARALAAFGRERALVLLESDDPLFARLAALGKELPGLRLVRRLSPAERATLGERAAVTAEAGRLLDALDRVRVPVAGVPAVAVAELAGDRARIELTAAPSRPVPLWIRQGYLPNWTNEGGAPIWLATPTFQLTFADRRETRLTFRRHPAALPGTLLSLAGVAGLAALGWGRRRVGARGV